ncbi:chromosome partitioning protein ParB [Cyanosarcina cf. burmensis CCALA 770]|nr:chromosome partitioning protein ParB [Cyanosarcina cf. burmensis CCALA 770]
MALPKIETRFNGAVQKTAQERKIVELQAEIERLRAAQSPNLEAHVQELRQQLLKSGENQIKLSSIDPNPHQPRQTITPSAIQAKARSLKKHGQIAPVILIAREERYILLDGQLRTEGAKLLGWETIRAVIIPMPEDLSYNSLLTFLHFEDLNPLDKAEAVMQQVSKVTGLKVDEISTTLSTVLKRIERDGKTKELANSIAQTTEKQSLTLEELGIRGKEQHLLLELLDLGLNPGSVKANLLPMLSLPLDLKAAIRHQGLKGAHALALSTLSTKTLNLSDKQAAAERIAATEQVIKQDLTVSETRKLVTQIKAKFSPNTESQSRSLLERMQIATRKIKKAKSWEDSHKLMQVESLLSELEKLIES